MWVSVLRIVHDRIVFDPTEGLVCPGSACGSHPVTWQALPPPAERPPVAERAAALRLTLLPPGAAEQPETAW